MMLAVSTTLKRKGFIGLGILPEDGCPRGPGKDGWSDRGRREDKEGDWGLDLGSGRPHRKYRSSSAFSRFPKAPPASRMEPAPESILSDCRESRGREKKKSITRERGPALRDGSCRHLPSPSRSLGFAGPSHPRHRAEPEQPTPSLPLSSALLSSLRGSSCFSPSALTARAAGLPI